jgi:hypothetical protein
MAKGRRYRVVRASRPSRMGRVWSPVDVGRSTYRDIRPRGSLAPRLGLLWSAVRAVTTKIPGCRGYAVLVALLAIQKTRGCCPLGVHRWGFQEQSGSLQSCENIEFIKTRLARLFSPCTSKYLRRYQSKRPVENAGFLRRVFLRRIAHGPAPAFEPSPAYEQDGRLHGVFVSQRAPELRALRAYRRARGRLARRRPRSPPRRREGVPHRQAPRAGPQGRHLHPQGQPPQREGELPTFSTPFEEPTRRRSRRGRRSEASEAPALRRLAG